MTSDSSVVKHATVSGYLFCHLDGEWHLGLIDHPRLGVWHPPGGHVEPDEAPSEAVIREIHEETGLRKTSLHLISPDGPAMPPNFRINFCETQRELPRPWWVTDEVVGADGSHGELHHHVDHHYLLVSSSIGLTGGTGQHPFYWFTLAQLSELPMGEDFRALAIELFNGGSFQPTARLSRVSCS